MALLFCLSDAVGRDLTADFHPHTYLLEIFPVALLLHAAILATCRLLREGGRAIDEQNQPQNGNARNRNPSHLYLLYRHAESGTPIEALRAPCKHPSFQSPRTVSLPMVKAPRPFGFPLRNSPSYRSFWMVRTPRPFGSPSANWPSYRPLVQDCLPLPAWRPPCHSPSSVS